MGTTFARQGPADWPCVALTTAVQKWHPLLAQAEVSFRVDLAHNEADFPLKAKGHKILACIRVVPYLWRVGGAPDVLLQIDAQEWEWMERDLQYALLDHELSHITLKKYRSKPGDEPGSVILTSFDRDDLGRPKLATKPGDWMGGDGFLAVVERHGEAAIELINAHRVAELVEKAKEGTRR